MILHDPVARVEVVDVLLDDVVAAEPIDVEPVVEMVLGQGHPLFPLAIPDVARVEVGVEGRDFAELAVLNGSDEFRMVEYMPAVATDNPARAAACVLVLSRRRRVMVSPRGFIGESLSLE
jgi:hypothetical protein